MERIAPIHSAEVDAVYCRRRGFSVVLVVSEQEAAAVRAWLWGIESIHRGRALGAKFRLTLDSVALEGSRITAWMNAKGAGLFICLTSKKRGRAPVIAWRVGQVVNEVTLERLDDVADPRQVELFAAKKKAQGQRVTMEVEETKCRP